VPEYLPLPRFHLPLIEPGVRIGRTRLSDKDSHLRMRELRGGALKPQQAQRLVQAMVRVACPLRPPQFEFPRQPATEPITSVSVHVVIDRRDRPQTEIVGPATQQGVEPADHRVWVQPQPRRAVCSRSFRFRPRTFLADGLTPV